ncbi:hypothetical protein LHJ74_26845 [Streptomyces sp. N2-109]|uniref:Uncharacterized protein n=1 Tax=Streptomyces gossypii TaxID=2883101 RepID=A0ABT2JZZ1_9ACTN|nr:hypothetical protein [Streptomyces gossypii]MCT2593482.1 hypothetical protein [Streptomyces gossypii]
MSRSQLAPGIEVVTVPGEGGGLALRTADGEFLRVGTGGVSQDALLARLTAGAGQRSGDAALDQIIEAFHEAGYLRAEAAEPRWPSARRDVWLLGAPALTAPLTAHLEPLGAVPRQVAPDRLAAFLGRQPSPGERRSTSGPDSPAAVVWCLDEPVSDGLWDGADHLPSLGVCWLRCHREGWQMWAEPPAAGPGDVTSAHVRARRLAATPAHRELAAYWSGARTAGAPAQLSTTGAALVAALLCADLTDWATGSTQPDHGLPAHRRLRRIDLRDLTVSEHPVLPVPDVAPLPPPRHPVPAGQRAGQ